MVVVLLDALSPAAELEKVVARVREHIRPGTRVIWVRSKVDLAQGSTPLPGLPEVLEISALTGYGLDSLKKAIASDATRELKAADGLLVTNQRHQEALAAAAEDLARFLEGLATSLPTDLLSEDLRSATRHLGTIFGEVTPDNVLGEIFGRFCIGK